MQEEEEGGRVMEGKESWGEEREELALVGVGWCWCTPPVNIVMCF